MEPEKASTRMKTKKTKMLISFKNMFCSKNRQIKHKSLFWIWKFEFEIWIWNVTNQMIVFSAFIQSGYLAFNWVPFQRSKINNYEDMPYNKSFIDQAGWILALVFFLRFYGPRLRQNAKRELGQYPAILTSRLVNNIYVLALPFFSIFL